MTKERKEEIVDAATLDCYIAVLEEVNGFSKTESKGAAIEDIGSPLYSRFQEIILKALNKRK